MKRNDKVFSSIHKFITIMSNFKPTSECSFHDVLTFPNGSYCIDCNERLFRATVDVGESVTTVRAPLVSLALLFHKNVNTAQYSKSVIEKLYMSVFDRLVRCIDYRFPDYSTTIVSVLTGLMALKGIDNSFFTKSGFGYRIIHTLKATNTPKSYLFFEYNLLLSFFERIPRAAELFLEQAGCVDLLLHPATLRRNEIVAAGGRDWRSTIVKIGIFLLGRSRSSKYHEAFMITLHWGKSSIEGFLEILHTVADQSSTATELQLSTFHFLHHYYTSGYHGITDEDENISLMKVLEKILSRAELDIERKLFSLSLLSVILGKSVQIETFEYVLNTDVLELAMEAVRHASSVAYLNGQSTPANITHDKFVKCVAYVCSIFSMVSRNCEKLFSSHCPVTIEFLIEMIDRLLFDTCTNRVCVTHLLPLLHSFIDNPNVSMVVDLMFVQQLGGLATKAFAYFYDEGGIVQQQSVNRSKAWAMLLTMQVVAFRRYVNIIGVFDVQGETDTRSLDAVCKEFLTHVGMTWYTQVKYLVDCVHELVLAEETSLALYRGITNLQNAMIRTLFCIDSKANPSPNAFSADDHWYLIEQVANLTSIRNKWFQNLWNSKTIIENSKLLLINEKLESTQILLSESPEKAKTRAAHSLLQNGDVEVLISLSLATSDETLARKASDIMVLSFTILNLISDLPEKCEAYYSVFRKCLPAHHRDRMRLLATTRAASGNEEDRRNDELKRTKEVVIAYFYFQVCIGNQEVNDMDEMCIVSYLSSIKHTEGSRWEQTRFILALLWANCGVSNAYTVVSDAASVEADRILLSLMAQSEKETDKKWDWIVTGIQGGASVLFSNKNPMVRGFNMGYLERKLKLASAAERVEAGTTPIEVIARCIADSQIGVHLIVDGIRHNSSMPDDSSLALLQFLFDGIKESPQGTRNINSQLFCDDMFEIMHKKMQTSSSLRFVRCAFALIALAFEKCETSLEEKLDPQHLKICSKVYERNRMRTMLHPTVQAIFKNIGRTEISEMDSDSMNVLNCILIVESIRFSYNEHLSQNYKFTKFDMDIFFAASTLLNGVSAPAVTAPWKNTILASCLNVLVRSSFIWGSKNQIWDSIPILAISNCVNSSNTMVRGLGLRLLYESTQRFDPKVFVGHRAEIEERRTLILIRSWHAGLLNIFDSLFARSVSTSGLVVALLYRAIISRVNSLDANSLQNLQEVAKMTRLYEARVLTSARLAAMKLMQNAFFDTKHEHNLLLLLVHATASYGNVQETRAAKFSRIWMRPFPEFLFMYKSRVSVIVKSSATNIECVTPSLWTLTLWTYFLFVIDEELGIVSKIKDKDNVARFVELLKSTKHFALSCKKLIKKKSPPLGSSPNTSVPHRKGRLSACSTQGRLQVGEIIPSKSRLLSHLAKDASNEEWYADQSMRSVASGSKKVNPEYIKHLLEDPAEQSKRITLKRFASLTILLHKNNCDEAHWVRSEIIGSFFSLYELLINNVHNDMDRLNVAAPRSKKRKPVTAPLRNRTNIESSKLLAKKQKRGKDGPGKRSFGRFTLQFSRQKLGIRVVGSGIHRGSKKEKCPGYCVVTYVDETGPSQDTEARSKLVPGDCIIKVNGVEIPSSYNISQITAMMAKSRPLSLDVERRNDPPLLAQTIKDLKASRKFYKTWQGKMVDPRGLFFAATNQGPNWKNVLIGIGIEDSSSARDMISRVFRYYFNCATKAQLAGTIRTEVIKTSKAEFSEDAMGTHEATCPTKYVTITSKVKESKQSSAAGNSYEPLQKQKESRRRSYNKYRATEKGKAALARYRATEKGKAALARANKKGAEKRRQQRLLEKSKSSEIQKLKTALDEGQKQDEAVVAEPAAPGNSHEPSSGNKPASTENVSKS